MLEVKYNSGIKKNYYELISKRKMRKYNNRTFESYYNQYIKYKLNNYDLRDILCGDFNKLLEIKNAIRTKYKNSSNVMKKFFNYDKKSKKFNSKTSYFQTQISKFVEENIQLHTCYYCNIDYINTFEKNKEIKNAFTLDHILEKADYPYLGLSLYNLAPSCYTCNSKVKDSKIVFDEFSPTSVDFDFDSKVKFKSFIVNDNLEITNKSDFLVKLVENNTNKFDKYIESLNLNGRYNYHKYKVLEMIEKRKVYTDSRIKELSDLTSKTENEIKQDLFGIYMTEDLHYRPFSKLIKDISKELKL